MQSDLSHRSRIHPTSLFSKFNSGKPELNGRGEPGSWLERIQWSHTRAFPTDVIVKQPLTQLSSSGSTGRSSIPETPDLEPRRLGNTGCPACAEHDGRENMRSRSRGAFCPSHARNLDPPQIGGRRKGRVPARTRGPSREKSRAKARSPQVAAENTPAFPAQWFYGLYALSSASQCLIATVASAKPFGFART